ncbi:MAG: hypothetical protein Q7S40_19635 [Opitutaceae bacterium]|nr:hypothetical protein [Opitutaceae bacterium]
MIELHSDELIFTFPKLHACLREKARGWIDARVAAATSEEKARLPDSREKLHAEFEWCIPKVRAAISFLRTLRIPDDGKDYPLPPGLGRFPVRHVDDFSGVPEAWKGHGGVMMPMHKTEALWLHFSSDYPMALKIGAGGICAISGERWSTTLYSRPQNYVVLPYQPWLDGFRVSEGVIRQFVAVPLGKGLTVEQQLTGEETWGGLQVQAFPMLADHNSTHELELALKTKWQALIRPPDTGAGLGMLYSMECITRCCVGEAGLGAGGRMKQKITRDPHGSEAWDLAENSRCYVHLCMADDWRNLTGTPPPHRPPTARDYTNAGLPWFDFDACTPPVSGETLLAGVKSVNSLIGEKTGMELSANDTITPSNMVQVRPRPTGVVREF